VFTFVALTLDSLDDPTPIGNLYTLFFHYLDYVRFRWELRMFEVFVQRRICTSLARRTPVCEILYRVTQREHVTSYRARRL
jgi:hypothetical protein